MTIASIMVKKEFTATEVMALLRPIEKGIQNISKQCQELGRCLSRLEKTVDRVTDTMDELIADLAEIKSA